MSTLAEVIDDLDTIESLVCVVSDALKEHADQYHRTALMHIENMIAKQRERLEHLQRRPLIRKAETVLSGTTEGAS